MAEPVKTHFGAKDKKDGDDDETSKKDTVELMKSENFADVLVKNFRKRLYTDIDILIDDHAFQCHLLLLRCYADYFKNIKPEKQMTLPSSEISPKGFEHAYEYMLCEEEFELAKFDLPEVLKAANFLQIKELLELCWQAYEDTSMYDDYDYLCLYWEAEKHDVSILKTTSLRRIGKAFLSFVASADFKKLDAEAVCQLLKLHNIGVHSELQILLAAVFWLSHEWPKREACVGNLLHCVRYPLLPQNIYSELVLSKNLEMDLQRVLSVEGVEKILTEGMLLTYNVNRGIDVKPADRCWLTSADGTIPNYCSNIELDDKLMLLEPFKEHLAEIKELEEEFMDEIVEVNNENLALASVVP